MLFILFEIIYEISFFFNFILINFLISKIYFLLF